MDSGRCNGFPRVLSWTLLIYPDRNRIPLVAKCCLQPDSLFRWTYLIGIGFLWLQNATGHTLTERWFDLKWISVVAISVTFVQPELDLTGNGFPGFCLNRKRIQPEMVSRYLSRAMVWLLPDSVSCELWNICKPGIWFVRNIVTIGNGFLLVQNAAVQTL